MQTKYIKKLLSTILNSVPNIQFKLVVSKKNETDIEISKKDQSRKLKSTKSKSRRLTRQQIRGLSGIR